MSLLRDNWLQVLASLLLKCTTEISADKVGFRVNTDVGYLQYSLKPDGNCFSSPIRTVIVSQGDVSDFHHIQGEVGDLIAVRIQDVGVFLSPPP